MSPIASPGHSRSAARNCCGEYFNRIHEHSDERDISSVTSVVRHLVIIVSSIFRVVR